MKSNYKYYNRNPQNVTTEDCVCRAISTATGLQYNAVNHLLGITANISKCPKLSLSSYRNLLERILCYDCYDCEGETVGDIAEQYPYCNVIIRIEGHLTCSIKGCVIDIWDCTENEADCYWIII